MTPLATLDMTIRGIPCQVRVTRYERKRALPARLAHSDDECSDGAEIEYAIEVRDAFVRALLQKAMTNDDYDDLRAEIIQRMEE